MKLKNIIEDQNANAILMLVGMAIGILILIVVVSLVPAVSYNVQSSVIIPNQTTSDAAMAWNGTVNTAFTNGSEMWAQLSPMMSTTALVAVVGVLIAVLLGALAMRK